MLKNALAVCKQNQLRQSASPRSTPFRGRIIAMEGTSQKAKAACIEPGSVNPKKAVNLPPCNQCATVQSKKKLKHSDRSHHQVQLCYQLAKLLHCQRRSDTPEQSAQLAADAAPRHRAQCLPRCLRCPQGHTKRKPHCAADCRSCFLAAPAVGEGPQPTKTTRSSCHVSQRTRPNMWSRLAATATCNAIESHMLDATKRLVSTEP